MPRWTTNIPADPRGIALPLRRTPPAKPLVAIATSDDLIGCDTHFFKGKTVPCERPECPACQAGLPYRWHAYFAAIDTTTRLHFILETTAQAAESFRDYRDAHGTLRGCLFETTRIARRHNGRILVRTRPADLRAEHLPKPPDVAAAMAIIWQLSSNNVSVSGLTKDVGRLDVDNTHDPSVFPPSPEPKETPT